MQPGRAGKSPQVRGAPSASVPSDVPGPVASTSIVLQEDTDYAVLDSSNSNHPEMTELNTPYAFWLVSLSTVMGILSLYGLHTARRMARFPQQYRQKLLEKEPTHLLAILWIQSGGDESIRRWGIALSRLALAYAVFSFATAGIVSSLIAMDSAGMDNAVGPLVDVLSKVESRLAC